jgi:hypothetical protein
MLSAGIFNILWLAVVITKILDIKELLRATWENIAISLRYSGHRIW